MRFTCLLILIVLISCTSNEFGSKFEVPVIEHYECHAIDSSKLNDRIPFTDEYGKRVYFDSLNFSIIRRWFDNDNLYIESIVDKDVKLDYWKEYYENGQLKESGIMTYGSHHYIGKWHYYSENGELDSLIDFDKKFNISYHDAILIASKSDYNMPDIDIGLTKEKNINYWRVNKWKEWENEGGRDAESILINCETGIVSKPEYKISAIY